MKLIIGTLRAGKRKDFFTVHLINLWNSLLQNEMKAASLGSNHNRTLEVPKRHSNVVVNVLIATNVGGGSFQVGCVAGREIFHSLHHTRGSQSEMALHSYLSLH